MIFPWYIYITFPDIFRVENISKHTVGKNVKSTKCSNHIWGSLLNSWIDVKDISISWQCGESSHLSVVLLVLIIIIIMTFLKKFKIWWFLPDILRQFSNSLIFPWMLFFVAIFPDFSHDPVTWQVTLHHRFLNMGKIWNRSEKVSPNHRVSPHRSVTWRQVLLYSNLLDTRQTYWPVYWLNLVHVLSNPRVLCRESPAWDRWISSPSSISDF